MINPIVVAFRALNVMDPKIIGGDVILIDDWDEKLKRIVLPSQQNVIIFLQQ